MRLLVAAGLLVVGAATALASVALHQHWWGLLLVSTATGSSVAALPPGWWARLAFVAGWVGFVAWVVPSRPEGDYLIGQDLPGYTLLGLAVVLLVHGLVTLPRPGSRRRRLMSGSPAPPA